MSEKDTKHELLKDFDSPFSIDFDLYPKFCVGGRAGKRRDAGIRNPCLL